MSEHVEGILEDYDGVTDLRSSGRRILQMAKEHPGVTEAQKRRVDQILRAARQAAAAAAAKSTGTEEPKRDVHAERLQEFAEQEASIQRRELTADLNVALTQAGASGQDLEDARALLGPSLDGSTDPQVIRTAVDTLKARRPTFFGTDPTPVPPKRTGRLPKGGPQRQKKQPDTGSGAADRARAARRWPDQ